MPRWLSVRVVLLSALLGGLGTLLIGGLYLASQGEAGMPPLTEAAFHAAEARWRKLGPASYDLDVEISGGQSGQFHVEVRDGEVTACTRNGLAPRRHTWETWTVAGQFETLELELQGAADPQSRYGVPAGTQVIQQALFDTELGYPLRYERHVMGANLPVAWRVTRFAPVK